MTNETELPGKYLENILTDNLPSARIWVAGNAPDFLVRVVDDTFNELSTLQRETYIARALGTELYNQVALIEIYTPEEVPFAPPLFKITTELPPTWSTALKNTRPADNESIYFASDLDEDLDRPPIITFYGLRGGTGRSTALVATARILAETHKLRVLCLDMDLEAPALSYLFGINADVDEATGILPLLAALEIEDVDITTHILPVPDSPNLLCLPAGRLGVDYAERLAALDVDTWYREERNPLHRLLDLLDESKLSVDVILIDSRTGLSPIAGPLLFDISDMAIVFFQPQAQSREGTALLTAGMLASKTQRKSTRKLTPEPRFVVSPVPPGPSGEAAVNRATEWVDDWLTPLTHRGKNSSEPEEKAPTREAIHTISYDASLAFRDHVSGPPSTFVAYEKLADWVRQLAPGRVVDTEYSVATAKQEILGTLHLEASTAESQESLLDDFVVTAQVTAALSPHVPLIVGRKGTGKTALFRWMAEQEPSKAIIATAPNLYARRPTWSLGLEAYSAVDRAIEENDLFDWRVFWLCYIVRVVGLHIQKEDVSKSGLPAVPAELRPALEGQGQTEVVTNLLTCARAPFAALKASDWLTELSTALPEPMWVLFDGLDTAFGYTFSDAQRRNRALSALMTVQAENNDRLPQLPFKIFVRQDIWESLTFQNKSHYLGALRLQLRWEEPADLYKVLLKQAVKNSQFQKLALANIPTLSSDVSLWTRDQVDRAWTLLVAERMRGEQTAFTWNWVWNRLADANSDHSPRTLVQLFSEALRLETVENRRAPYDRSVIRPRLLIPSLLLVSENALDALLSEEFPILSAVADALRTHGRTPVSATELSLEPDLLNLAADAGLIRQKEVVGGEPFIRVPDLYRHALGVTRPGPA